MNRLVFSRNMRRWLAPAALVLTSSPLQAQASLSADAVQDSDCPAAAPAQGDACPKHGMTCSYEEASCADPKSPFDTIAICLHGQFSVHGGLSGC